MKSVSVPESHGKSQVYWEGNVLLIKPKGAFNMEGVQQVAAAVKECIENRPSDNWVRLYVFEDMFTLGPPESVQLVIEHMRNSRALGCKKLVVVGGNCINKESLIYICTQSDMPLEFCDSFEDGLAAAQNETGD